MSKRLVDLSFPVVYGISLLDNEEGRVKRVSSDVPGETAIRFGVSPEEIRVIYTEDKYVDLVFEVVHESGNARSIKVKPFSQIQK